MTTEIDISKVTTSKINGTGSFDILMGAMSAQLQSEYGKQRIVSSDYSKIYLGGLQAVLAQSAQFELTKGQAAAQEDLIRQQIENLILEAEKSKIELIGLVKDNTIKDKQIEKMEQEVLVLQQQVLQGAQQVLLMKEQTLKTTAETELTKQNTLNAEIESRNLVLRQDNLISENGLIKQKTYTEEAQISDTANGVAVTGLIGKQKEATLAGVKKTEQDTANALTQNRNLVLAQDKSIAEKDLLQQKAYTEMAQISNIVNGNTVTGVVGKQKELYQKQAEGFDRDAEQKLAKIYVDTWSVRRSTDPDATAAEPAGLGDGDINAVLDVARNGII
jgi:hypothetical protein